MMDRSPAPPADAAPQRLLRVKDVLIRLNVSKSSLYRMIQAGVFPPPIEITPNWKAWSDVVVDDWIRDHAEGSPTVN